MRIEKSVFDFISTAFFESVKISPDGDHILYSYKIPSADNRNYVEKVRLFNTKNFKEEFFRDNEESAVMPKWSPGGAFFSIINQGMLKIFNDSFSRCIKEISIEGSIVDYQWGKDDDSLWVLTRKANLVEPDMPIQIGNFNFPSNIVHINLRTDEKTTVVNEKTGSISDICTSQKENKLYYTLKEDDIYDYASQIKEFDYDQQTLKLIDANIKFSAIKLVGIYGDNKLVFLGYDAYPPNHCMARRYFCLDCTNGNVKLLMVPIAERGTAIEALIVNDGTDILIKENASSKCLLYSLEQRILERTITLEKSISHISISRNGRITFVAQDFNTAPNVYFTNIADMENYSLYKKISAINDNEFKLKTEMIYWESSEGKDIEGILVYPLNYQGSKQYPLVVITTGRSNCFTRAYLGFSDLTGNNEKVPYPVALLAKKGYFVLLANSRSSRYHEFEDLNNRTSEVLDGYCSNVLSGIEKAIEENKSIDSSRIAVMGWVLGGYISARIASRPNNNIKVLVVGNAVTDLISMFSCSNCYEFKAFMREGFWESEETLGKYLKTSPVKYVKNIKAATLIQHGSKEPSMPVEQGREFYYALRLSNKEVRMTEYPNLEHQFNNPQDLAFATQEVLDWLEQKL